MTAKSKTSCFTINKVPLTTVKDAFYECKTTCFTTSDGSVRFKRTVT